MNSQQGLDHLENNWGLPTPPGSRDSSPKTCVRSTTSSSTLIAPPNHQIVQSESQNNFSHCLSHGSPEWERERWQHWEMMAAEKKNANTAEQETLV